MTAGSTGSLPLFVPVEAGKGKMPETASAAVFSTTAVGLSTILQVARGSQQPYPRYGALTLLSGQVTAFG